MKWKKLGLIFNAHGQQEWMKSHASVPFAEFISDDLFRIYFSTRDGQNRSQVGFLELNIKQPQRIINLSSEPILGPGGMGFFDADGAMLSWIERNKGEKLIYYIGWNLAHGVPFRNSIGLAFADDSFGSFRKQFEGPIVDRSIFDPCFVASCCVLKEGDKWRMWYLSCLRWEKTRNDKLRHRYHIKYAESKDGIYWERNGKVCIDFKNEDEYAISRPSVLKEEGLYKMWYSYRGDCYQIGYAESVDGLKWIRKDEQAGIETSLSGWDSEMIEYPHVFVHEGRKYMLYNGNGYGKTGFGLAVLED